MLNVLKYLLQDGKTVPISVAIGDKVLLPEYGGTKIEFDDQVCAHVK